MERHGAVGGDAFLVPRPTDEAEDDRDQAENNSADDGPGEQHTENRENQSHCADGVLRRYRLLLVSTLLISALLGVLAG